MTSKTFILGNNIPAGSFIDIETLKQNETIYEISQHFTANSVLYPVTIPEEAVVLMDRYADGADALVTKVDSNNRPIDEPPRDSLGNIIVVTTFADAMDGNGNWYALLSGTPATDVAIIFQIKIQDQYKQNVSISQIVSQYSINLPDSYYNVYRVDQEIGDFTRLDECLNWIKLNTTPSPTNRYLILLSPDTYQITASVELLSYVTVKGVGSKYDTIIEAPAADDLFDFVGIDSCLENVTLKDVAATYYAVKNLTNNGISEFKNILIQDCANGFQVNQSGIISMKLINIDFKTTGANVITKGIEVTAGDVQMTNIKVIGDSSITTLYDISGSDSNIVTDLITKSSNVDLVMNADDGCSIDLISPVIENCTDVFNIEGTDTFFDIKAGHIRNVTNDVFILVDSSTGIVVTVYGTVATDTGRYSFNVTNENAIILGNGYTELSKVNAVQGTKFLATIQDVLAGIDGTNLFGNVYHGTPLNPASAHFGSGGAYTRGMVFYTYNGTVYTNETVAVSSPSGSTVAMPNTSTNSAFYIASAISRDGDRLKHSGIYLNVTTSAVLGAGNFIVEIWNGTSYQEAKIAVRKTSDDYLSFADSILETTGEYDISYDISIIESASSWTKNDPVGLGVDLYWSRIRIENAITTAPVIEQCKIQPDSTIIKPNGFFVSSGEARPQRTLSWKITDAKAWGSSPGNQDLYVLNSADGADYDQGVGRTENNYQTGVTDKFSIGLPLPLDLDTSCYIELEIYYQINNASAGNINWKSSKGIVGVGEGVTSTVGAAPTSVRDYGITNNILPISANSDNVMLYFKTQFYFSKAIARKTPNGDSDNIMIVIVRDGSDASDTYIGDARIFQVRANYYAWSLGGHRQ